MSGQAARRERLALSGDASQTQNYVGIHAAGDQDVRHGDRRVLELQERAARLLSIAWGLACCVPAVSALRLILTNSNFPICAPQHLVARMAEGHGFKGISLLRGKWRSMWRVSKGGGQYLSNGYHLTAEEAAHHTDMCVGRRRRAGREVMPSIYCLIHLRRGQYPRTLSLL